MVDDGSGILKDDFPDFQLASYGSSLGEYMYMKNTELPQLEADNYG